MKFITRTRARNVRCSNIRANKKIRLNSRQAHIFFGSRGATPAARRHCARCGAQLARVIFVGLVQATINIYAYTQTRRNTTYMLYLLLIQIHIYIYIPNMHVFILHIVALLMEWLQSEYINAASTGARVEYDGLAAVGCGIKGSAYSCHIYIVHSFVFVVM